VSNDIHNISLPGEAEVIPVAAVPVADPEVSLLLAVAHAERWAILRELSIGDSLSVQELANRVGCTPNQASKHMTALRTVKAVVTVERAGEDGRKQFYTVADEFRRTGLDGSRELDYGSLVLRFLV
jgi:predicted ArsR family transcriptional regulator